MKKTVIYCRVGTANEDDNSSLQAQEAACRQYLAALEGYEVVEVISVVEAWEKPDRAGIKKLIEMAAEKQLNTICIQEKEVLEHESDAAVVLIRDLVEVGAEVLFVNDNGDAGADTDGNEDKG